MIATIDRQRHLDKKACELPEFPGVWAYGELGMFVVKGPPEALCARPVLVDKRSRQTILSGLCIPINYLPHGGWRFHQPVEDMVNRLLDEAAENARDRDDEQP